MVAYWHMLVRLFVFVEVCTMVAYSHMVVYSGVKSTYFPVPSFFANLPST